jgi:hypothetical protein
VRLRLEEAVTVAATKLSGKKPLPQELRRRYLQRALVFWAFVHDARIHEWQKLARKATWRELKWEWPALGITAQAQDAASNLGFVPSELFAHPEVIAREPSLFNYYRMLACLPEKGLAQMMKGTKDRSVAAKCFLLNQMIGELLQTTTALTGERIANTLFAEAGSEWQGSWVNRIGQSAAQSLEALLISYIEQNKLGAKSLASKSKKQRSFVLKKGTVITFGSEPDVEFRGADGSLTCVIEIKGSADSAGAQTRLGETKKSFAKAKKENRHCATIFMPSVTTPAVEKQLKSEGEVDHVFNLLNVTSDSRERKRFLNELFHHILREDRNR